MSELTPLELSRFASFEIRAKMIVDGWLTGEHAGRRRGFASDFSEHRDYVPGDDLRHLDWKAFARRDRFYVRQFEEEARIRISIILDVSNSMRYQSDGAVFSKLEYGAHVAAVLGWIALSQGDDVQLIFAGQNHSSRKTTSEHQSGGHSFAKFDLRSGTGDEEQLIHRLERELKRNSEDGSLKDEDIQTGAWGALLVPQCPAFFISDLFVEMDEFESVLRQAQHQQADLRVVQVLDSAEKEFPFTGNVAFHDLESESRSVIPTDAVREVYRAEFADYLAELQVVSRARGVAVESVQTDQAIDAVLQRMLSTRI